MHLVKVMLIALLAFAFTVFAVPAKMNYQAKLTDPDGIAVEGTVVVKFTIWNAETGGDSLWFEIDTVVADHGLFDVVLGNRNPIDVDFSEERWMQLEVESEILDPRQPITSVPSAFRAEVAESLVGGVILDHNDLSGLQGGDPIGDEFYHLTATQYGNLHAPGSDNQNIFASITDGTDRYFAASETDDITFTGTGGATVTVDDITGEVTIDASSAGDDWGDQNVNTDGTLNGNGDETALSVNWGSVTQHTDVTDAGSGEIITTAERNQITTNATNIGDLLYEEENFVVNGEPLTESVDKLDMELADVIGGVSGAYIQNQEAGAQTANYWIDGDGTVEGNFTAGNIVGQGSMSSGVASPVGISSPTTPVELASLTYSGYGPGSTIHLSFTGTFDDRGGQDGAYVLVELVRDPGASETVISTSQISIYSPVVYQLQSVAINGVDTPPAGSHTYVIRASVVRSPYTSGRCLNGVFKLAEIKE